MPQAVCVAAAMTGTSGSTSSLLDSILVGASVVEVGYVS